MGVEHAAREVTTEASRRDLQRLLAADETGPPRRHTRGGPFRTNCCG
jgi:hypothetical protein